jgi:hypothetical protein
MTVRRALGTGPQEPAGPIQAKDADLLPGLPGIDLPDAAALRDRGLLAAGTPPEPAPGPASTGASTAKTSPRRVLKTDGHTETDAAL